MAAQNIAMGSPKITLMLLGQIGAFIIIYYMNERSSLQIVGVILMLISTVGGPKVDQGEEG